MCKFYKVLSVENKMKWRLFYATIPRGWYEVAGRISNHEGDMIRKQEVLEKWTRRWFSRKKVFKEISYLLTKGISSRKSF